MTHDKKHLLVENKKLFDPSRCFSSSNDCKIKFIRLIFMVFLKYIKIKD